MRSNLYRYTQLSRVNFILYACQCHDPSHSFPPSSFTTCNGKHPLLPTQKCQARPYLSEQNGKKLFCLFSLLRTHFTTQRLMQLKSNRNLMSSTFLYLKFTRGWEAKSSSLITHTQNLDLWSTFVVFFGKRGWEWGRRGQRLEEQTPPAGSAVRT